MGHKLLILSYDEERYRLLIEKARPAGLELAAHPQPDVDIVLGEPDRIKPALATLPALAWAQSTWVGVEPLLAPSLRRDYILTNARGIFSSFMSEYVIGYLLAHERRILQRHKAQERKTWDFTSPGTLRGKTLGLLGVGSVGAEIARAAKFFGMTVRGYTRNSRTSPHVDAYYHGKNLPEFASGLDYLVNVLPNTAHTCCIVNAELLGALPTHALFINVGRGSAVDEPALVEALSQDRIAGAVLDVFAQEPLPEDHPFWTTKNLLMTFHTSSPNLPEDTMRLFLENYALLNAGKRLKHQVDFEKGY